jgi:hypothetical protein
VIATNYRSHISEIMNKILIKEMISKTIIFKRCEEFSIVIELLIQEMNDKRRRVLNFSDDLYDTNLFDVAILEGVLIKLFVV